MIKFPSFVIVLKKDLLRFMKTELYLNLSLGSAGFVKSFLVRIYFFYWHKNYNSLALRAFQDFWSYYLHSEFFLTFQ